MLDATVIAMNELQNARNPRKVLLVISDGGDNHSRYTKAEVENRAREAEVKIYTIGVYESFGVRTRSPEERTGPDLLQDLSEKTGGKHFVVDTSVGNVPDAGVRIGAEIRSAIDR